MVIGASLWGAWLFAGVYSDGDDKAFYFMLLAPLVYAAVELCRVPLGILARTQRSYFIRARRPSSASSSPQASPPSRCRSSAR